MSSSGIREHFFAHSFTFKTDWRDKLTFQQQAVGHTHFVNFTFVSQLIYVFLKTKQYPQLILPCLNQVFTPLFSNSLPIFKHRNMHALVPSFSVSKKPSSSAFYEVCFFHGRALVDPQTVIFYVSF